MKLMRGVMSRFRHQQTIKSPQAYSGIGLHTGQEVEIRFVPAKDGEGIYFRRVDLPGQPVIPATVEYVAGTARGTTLAVGEAKVHTVEHVLSSVRAFDIDNLCIEISGIEPPAGNGSSDVYVEMLTNGGRIEQSAQIPIASLKNAVWWSQDEVSIIALPSDTYRISYTLHYPNTPALGSQYFSFDVSLEGFLEQICQCRTFALYDELTLLMDKGLIKGGSLENAVVVQEGAIISKGGLQFSDEAVRHKVLDLIGDLSLVGIPFTAHIIALRSGHASNCLFAKKLYQHLSSEST
jgi:UDP-3-O-[3-hydroxymyristoyl] N-acetylglucosamine deacetylase